MTMDGVGRKGLSAVLTSGSLYATSPQCKLQFSYYDNATVKERETFYAYMIDDTGNQTITTLLLWRQIWQSGKWKTYQMGIGNRPKGSYDWPQFENLTGARNGTDSAVWITILFTVNLLALKPCWKVSLPTSLIVQ